jgi:HPt (histidine-containing phosphotransfer) domain-containing protein
MKRRVNDASHKNLVMAYDPGTLNASLAAAVGSDSALMAELRSAFLESAARQLDLMGRARCDANWIIAASRLKSVAASFNVSGLVRLADEALDGAPGDPAVLKKITDALDEFATV